MSGENISTKGAETIQLFAIAFILDGAGAALLDGFKADSMFRAPFDLELQEATLLADQTGSITVAILKTDYASYDGGTTAPSFPGDDISNGGISISSGTKAENKTLAASGWSTTVKEDDIIALQVDGNATNIQTISLTLKARKAG